MLELTARQKEFFLNSGKRLNFLSGSVRSGKTYVSLLKWAMWVGTMPKDAEFIMVGKTVTSLRRNCLNLLQQMVGVSNFKFSTSSKFAVLFGRVVWLEGANDERSENKIRGMTLAGAYCDEITLFPKTFTSMLLSRLSYPNAKMWATCNPDNPNHYIKKDFIDNTELSINVWNFILTENTFLDSEYISNITKEYTGIYYQRFILGKWVRAEGVIYTDFVNDTESYIIDTLDELNERIVHIAVGVDFGGNMSATTFVCTGITQGYKQVVVLENERITKDITPAQLDELYLAFMQKCIRQYGKVSYVFCDSAEQILIRGILRITQKNGLPVIVQNAMKSKINERIQLVKRLQAGGRFKVMRHCKHVINALQEAVWDEKYVTSEARLDDGTSDIDTLDALEYSIERESKQLMDYILRR